MTQFIGWWLEPFALGFQQRALEGAIIAAVMASAVGVWLVLRGMSFFGDAFVHGVLPGIAAAVVFGFSPLLGAVLAAVVMVAGVEVVHRQTQLKEDTAIGLLFVGMLALGVVIISSSNRFSGDLTNILFGDTFGITERDVIDEALVAALVAVVSVVMYRPLLALTFSRSKAQTLGMRPGLAHALLLAMVAASVIGAFRTVGTLLVLGLMIGPPATAALLARSVPRMMLYSLVIAAFSAWAGLVLSYHAGTAGAATMALIPVVLFFATLACRELWRRVRPAQQEVTA